MEAGGKPSASSPLPGLRTFAETFTSLVHGEFNAAFADIQLMEHINTVALHTYTQLADSAAGLSTHLQRLLTKNDKIADTCQQLDAVEDLVSRIEQEVASLDRDSRELEARCKSLLQRSKTNP
eukprot:jgi/Mesvir1/28185/Mv04742-RA.1